MEKEKQSTENLPLHHVDYKDIGRLNNLVNAHARMMNRRRTGFSAKGQRNFATAVKRARFMALLPYLRH
ncbi:MAG: 30S ribosomal protein S18 [Patescibacteria group bacterium]